MSLVGLIVALVLLHRVRCHLLSVWARRRGLDAAVDDRHACGPASWHEAWHREWAEKFNRQAERRQQHVERYARHWKRKWKHKARELGLPPEATAWMSGVGGGLADVVGARPSRGPEGRPAGAASDGAGRDEDAAAMPVPDRHAENAVLGFYIHCMSYLGVIALLAFINLLTTRYPWFLWPALGWGLGLFSHYVGVFGTALFRRRWVEPAIEREVRREKAVMTSEKQASIDELSSTLAHEIRNPVAAAKSLVQQMGEDPTSLENVEYAKVALEELDRVERSIAHLLKYAREEDYQFAPVNVAAVVDAALTEMRAKLDGAKVSVARNYIGGPTIVADGEKLRRVFTNIIANAIDALAAVPEDRRIDCFVQNGGAAATIRLRDNGAGIPADRIDRIFNPFFTTKEHGTGLGMAISKKIVEAHEGSIDVTSEIGRGTEFVVTLPMPH